MKDSTRRAATTPEAPARKPRVQTAVRTVSILMAIAASENGLKAKEIVDRLGLPRQATYHLLHTLVVSGAIRKNEQNRYVLGLAIATLAEGFRRQVGPPAQLAAIVRHIASETGETAYAAGWLEGEIVNLVSVPGSNPIQAMSVPQGYSLHAHARATGKLLLAFASADVRERYLDGHELTARTARTLTSRERLEQEFARIREAGYAVDREEFTPGLCCLAVPAGGAYGVFAVGVSVPRDRFRQSRESLLAAMRAALGADLP